MAAAEKRVQAELANARDEGQKRIADAEKRAQMVADEIKANAQAEAEPHHRASQSRRRTASDQGARRTARAKLPASPSKAPSRSSSVK